MINYTQYIHSDKLERPELLKLGETLYLSHHPIIPFSVKLLITVDSCDLRSLLYLQNPFEKLKGLILMGDDGNGNLKLNNSIFCKFFKKDIQINYELGMLIFPKISCKIHSMLRRDILENITIEYSIEKTQEIRYGNTSQ